MSDRRIKLNREGAKIPDNVKELAKEVFKAAKLMNAEKRKHDSARRNLLKEQEASGISSFTCDAIVDGKKVTIDSSIITPKRVIVDIDLLRKHVSEEDFLKIVSATQKSVTDFAGKAILDVCSEEVDGTKNVTVKAAK